MLRQAYVALRWDMGPVQFDVVAFVGTESPEDVPCVWLGGVVVDAPIPLGVGLGFQGGPGSGQLFGGVVVR